MEGNEESQPNLADTKTNALLEGLVSPQTLVDVATIEVSKMAPDKKEEKKAEPEKKEAKTPKAEEKEVKTPKAEESEEEEQEEEEGEDGGEENKAEKKDDKTSKKDTKKKEVEIPENKFGFNLKKPKEGEKLKIESFDDVPKILETKYGQKIKDVTELPKFFETADKWRNDSQQLEKVKKEKDNAIAVFENLPENLLEAVKLHYAGEDYTKAIVTSKIDFSKPVDKQDPKDLVETYYPGEFSKEDFEEDSERAKEVQIAIKASKKEYTLEKQTRDQRAKDSVEKAKQKQKAFEASVESSVKVLKSSFPDVLPDVEADIVNTLNSGALMNEFFNTDGTLKANAAKMLMLAKHGEEFMSQLIQIAQNQGESQANEDFVERANKKKKAGNGDKPEPARKEIENMINEFIPKDLVSKKTF